MKNVLQKAIMYHSSLLNRYRQEKTELNMSAYRKLKKFENEKKRPARKIMTVSI